MKREARLLFTKSVDSLVLGIEHYNRPWDRGRVDAAIELTSTGAGPSLDLRISKKEGIPIQLVPEGTPGASVVAVHKVDSLGFYNLGRDQVAHHLGLSGPRTTALIQHARIKDDADCFRRIAIGKASFDRYLKSAIDRLREALKAADMDKVWAEYQAGRRRRTRP